MKRFILSGKVERIEGPSKDLSIAYISLIPEGEHKEGSRIIYMDKRILEKYQGKFVDIIDEISLFGLRHKQTIQSADFSDTVKMWASERASTNLAYFPFLHTHFNPTAKLKP